jgi:quercetin dioxygenase-like cupin family protein
MSRAVLIPVFMTLAAVAGREPACAQSVQSVQPDQIKWAQHPALPKGAMRAVVYGDPTKPGLYATRLRSPEGLRVMPHTHPEDRIYTVLSGTLYLGIGESFDEGKLQAYPAGSVVFLPAKLSHFQYARSDGYVIQISGNGPTDLTFINPSDDLRRH